MWDIKDIHLVIPQEGTDIPKDKEEKKMGAYANQDMSKEDWEKKDRFKEGCTNARTSFMRGMDLYIAHINADPNFVPDPKKQSGKFMIKSVETGLKWQGEPLIEEIKEKVKG